MPPDIYERTNVTRNFHDVTSNDEGTRLYLALYGSGSCANGLLILAAFAPTLSIALLLLLVRAALSQMDVPTRSSYVMAVVTEAERAAAASLTSVPRSLAAALSPTLAGTLMAASFRAWPLVICGALKIVYDLLLLMQFRHVKPPEER